MNPLTQFKTITLPILIAVIFACFGFSQIAQAQDGNELKFNTAEGGFALSTYIMTASNCFDDTAIGYAALEFNTTGSQNTAIGSGALSFNTTAGGNTATGWDALGSNTTGFQNTADGYGTLLLNNGDNNTATGFNALMNNMGGNNNTATGLQALNGNTDGTQNTATGVNALAFNKTGNNNTADGFQALEVNKGSYNTACGVNALLNNSSGTSNVGLGANAGQSLTTGSGNVCIGVNVFGVAGESNTTRIRNVYSSVASGRAVFVNSDSKIGTLSSSRRYKEEIKPMDKTSETILALKPVTFRYKKEVDAAQALCFGLIAEEVAEISPDLITRDEDGKPETVRYEAVNAMLLNEFIKEHKAFVEEQRKVAQLEATVAQQQKGMEALTAAMKEQAVQIQRVSASLR